MTAPFWCSGFNSLNFLSFYAATLNFRHQYRFVELPLKSNLMAAFERNGSDVLSLAENDRRHLA